MATDTVPSQQADGFAGLLARCAAQPDRFTDDDAAQLLASGDELAWGAIAYLRCYQGGSSFLRNLGMRVQSEQLTAAQLRGVLNYLRTEGRRQGSHPAGRSGGRPRQARPSSAGSRLPAGLATDLQDLLGHLEGGLAADQAAERLRAILTRYTTPRS
jgi:hypothetical protein